MGACLSSSPVAQKPSTSAPTPEGGAGKLNGFVNASPIDVMFPSYGSDEDVYFDAHTWIESDLDDEFLSANGDLTPSFTPNSGSHPVHLSDLATASRIPEDMSPTSQTKKSLFELLIEVKNEHQDQDISSCRNDLKSTAVAQDYDSTSLKSGNSRNHRSQKSACCLQKLFCVHIPESPNSNSGVAAH